MIGARVGTPDAAQVAVADRLDLLEPVPLDERVEAGEQPIEDAHNSAGAVGDGVNDVQALAQADGRATGKMVRTSAERSATTSSPSTRAGSWP